MHESHLILTVDQGVARITLDRPERHNAFDDILILVLTNVLNRLDHDPDIRCIVLAGSGQSFSAGADIQWMQRMATYSQQENLDDALGLARLMDTLYRLGTPTIARVHGAAMGGGVGLVAACDLAFASEQAYFRLSEVSLGLIPATISPYVIAAIGERQARRYFTTAERFSAQQAERIGLVHQVFADTEAMDAHIQQTLEAILNNGPEAIKAAQTLIREVVGRPIDDAMLTDTSERIARIRVSPEGQEGLSAFLDKRKPQWCPADA